MRGKAASGWQDQNPGHSDRAAGGFLLPRAQRGAPGILRGGSERDWCSVKNMKSSLKNFCLKM